MLKITKITIIKSRHGMDKVIFEFDILQPNGVSPDCPLSAMAHLPKDVGEEYVAKNFPEIPVEVISMDHGSDIWRFSE